MFGWSVSGKHQGRKKNNTLKYQEQDAELKARREGRAPTKVTARTPCLFSEVMKAKSLCRVTQRDRPEKRRGYSSQTTSNLVF